MAEEPPLVNVNVAFEALVVPRRTVPKVKLVADTFNAAVVAVPVPLRLTTCGLAPPSSVKVMVADREPSAVGVNVATSEQLVPGATVAPQLFDWIAKSPGFVPPKAMLEIFRVAVVLTSVRFRVRVGLV